MYMVTEFCRVCLQTDKRLKDIMKDKELPDSLFIKLKKCVSEIDWNFNKTMFLCDTCITKLNAAFEFKCQCIKSTETLKAFLTHIGIKDVIKTDPKLKGNNKTIKNNKKDEEKLKSDHFPIFPNSSNLFFNLVPAKLKKSLASTPFTKPSSKTVSQDSNQNNTFHNMIIYPITSSSEPSKSLLEYKNICSQKTEKNNSEELSIEIDPSYFEMENDFPSYSDKIESNILNDCQDPMMADKIISNNNENIDIQTQINKSLPTINKISEINNVFKLLINSTKEVMEEDGNNRNSVLLSEEEAFLNLYSSTCSNISDHIVNSDFEEQIEIFNGGHFMTRNEPEKPPVEGFIKIFPCEMCSKTFDSLLTLNGHIVRHHSGKFPYRCKYCFAEFAIRSVFREHLHNHLSDPSDTYIKDSFTLEDLNSENIKESLLYNCINYKPKDKEIVRNDHGGEEEGEGGEYKCEQCPMTFNNGHNLSRHRVGKHNLKTRKKYFIKGMKNARCDICNREFSTQSYLQLHVKLHYRNSYSRQKAFRKQLNVPMEDNEKKQNGDYMDNDNDMLDVDINVFDSEEDNTPMDVPLSKKCEKDSSSFLENTFDSSQRDTSIDTVNDTIDTIIDIVNSDTNLKSYPKNKASKNESKQIEIIQESEEIKDSNSVNDICTNEKKIIEIVSKDINLNGNSDVKQLSIQTKKLKTPQKRAKNENRDKNLVIKKLKTKNKAKQNTQSIKNTSPTANSLNNDDVTLSDIGIKLKFNLRNILQNDSEKDEDKKEQNNENKSTEVVEVKDEKIQEIEVKISDKDTKVIKIRSSRKRKRSVPKKVHKKHSTFKKEVTFAKNIDRKKEKALKETSRTEIKIEHKNLEELKDLKQVIPTDNKSKLITSLTQPVLVAEEVKPVAMPNLTAGDESNLVPVLAPSLVALVPHSNKPKAGLNSTIIDPPVGNISVDEKTADESENDSLMFFSGYKIELVNGKPKCIFCNKLFGRKHDLKRHMNNIHLKSIKYMCHLCDTAFYEAFHLTRHLRQHNFFLTCTACSKNFNALRELMSHVESVHFENVSIQCGTCRTDFPKMEGLKDHIQQHDKEVIYKCHLCEEEFSESRDLTKHLVGHSGMYSCPMCQAIVTSEHELALHLKVHIHNIPQDQSKYECKVCHNKYKKKRYLNTHMKHTKHYPISERKTDEENDINGVEQNSDDSTY